MPGKGSEHHATKLQLLDRPERKLSRSNPSHLTTPCYTQQKESLGFVSCLGRKPEHQGINMQRLGHIALKSERSNPSKSTSFGCAWDKAYKSSCVCISQQSFYLLGHE